MEEFSIIPVLGRKVDVPQNDPSLFMDVGGLIATHDVGGINFDLSRKRHACAKANGYSQWSAAANATATNCLGLFELYDGTNRDHVMFDAGKIYVYDSSRTPIATTCAGVTLKDDTDLYSMIRVGAYIVVTDWAENTPYKWKNADAGFTALINGGTAYKFRYLVNFARRVIGLYCTDDTGAPDLSIRWSSAWPSTAITSMTFAATDQLYIPNDDPIVGGATMGTEKCFIYCENSIQQLVYYSDYATPFRCFTVVPKKGAVNHHSIVNLGDRHLFFNREYGFMEYRGGNDAVPISDDIENDVHDMIWDNANLIVGTYVPVMRCAVWTVPMVSSGTPNRLLFYHIDTKQWWWMDRSFRYLDYWQSYSSYKWQDLIRDLGGLAKIQGTADSDVTNKLLSSGSDFTSAGVIVGDEAHSTTAGLVGVVTEVSATGLVLDTDAFPYGTEIFEVGTGATWADAGSRSWAYYASLASYLVAADTDGHLYTHTGESLPGSSVLDGYRIEPILDFGDPKRKDFLKEIWFQIGYAASHSIDVYYRGGDTEAEVKNQAWTSVGSISCNSPAKPVVYVEQSARLHQIKWGTDTDTEYFEISKIIFKFIPQGEN